MKKAVNIASLVGVITIFLLIIPNRTQAIQVDEVEHGLTSVLAVQKNEDGIHLKSLPHSGGRELDGYYEVRIKSMEEISKEKNTVSIHE